MSEEVDVIMIIPDRFEEIIEKTKNMATPWTREALQKVYERNNAKNSVGYIMIQNIKIAQLFEEEDNEVRPVVSEAPVQEGVQDSEETSTKAREGRTHGGIPRGF